ncbi:MULTISPECIES: NADase-type glycan-binding domain-containing protein [Streptomyces]|uniref:NAD glycohydrolase translocation F5/8 type C domain-containing protein n=2 Tax=Streptomyces TaxID=1883 RepID=A0ABV9IKA6_9ACTN
MSGPGGRACPDCGHHNAPGTAFCASCNAFLDWEENGAGSATGGQGQGTGTAPRAAVVEPAVSVPAVPAPVAPGTVAPDVSGSGPSVQGAAVAGPAPEPTATRTASVLPRPETSPPAPTQARAQPPGFTPEQTVPNPAGPSVPAVPSVPAAPAGPVRPRTPAEPGASGTVRRPGERSADPDDLPASADTQGTAATAPRPRTPVHDLICRACAQANPRTRTLCVRCGAVLNAPTTREERLSWWARLLRRLRRRPPHRLAAGQRPAARAWRRPSLAIPITLVLLLGGGYLVRPHLSGLIDNLRNQTAKPTPVNPKFAEASNQLNDHGPNLAFDGANNTYWAPASAGAGTGEDLEARFEQPVTLKKVIIHAGVSINKDEFLKQARPSVLDVELADPNGEVKKKQLKLQDKPGPQTLDLAGKNVSSVRFIIRSSYGVEGKDRHTAILEVEFFGLR